MKHSTRKLRQEYDSLSERYATVEKVLYNVIDRDKQVFRTLFESDPYNFDTEFEKKRWETHEKLLTNPTRNWARSFSGNSIPSKNAPANTCTRWRPSNKPPIR